MGLFEQFPYTNFHELNAEWLLKKMKELDQAMETFKATESLKFADPIIWDITTQYQKSTVVLDPTGNAYLSLQPVPAGVQLNNGEYWLEIFNFTDYTRTANQNLTVNVETNTTRATAAYQVDDWLIWNDVLYKVTSPIAIDDALIVAPAAGSNIIHFTVEDFIKAFITYATGLIQQYKNDIDASEVAYRNQLAQDISDTTASLQAQLDAAIAGATVDSEVINARIGDDNVTYTTLGDAIRTQLNNLKNVLRGELNLIWDSLIPGNLMDKDSYLTDKYVVPEYGTINNIAGYSASGYIPVEEGVAIALFSSTGGVLSNRNFAAIATYDKDLRLISGATRNVHEYTPASGVAFVRVSVDSTYLNQDPVIYTKHTGSYPTKVIETGSYSNPKLLNNFKIATPINYNGVKVSEDDDYFYVDVSTNFYTSDNTLTGSITATKTITKSTTLQGVVVNPATGDIESYTPTYLNIETPVYFVALCYNKKIFFNTLRLNDSNYQSRNNGFIRGKAFVWLGVNTLNIWATPNTRFIYNGLVQTTFESDLNNMITINTTTLLLKYLYYKDGALGVDVNVPKDAYILGYFYDYRFTALDDRIIANRIPVINIKQRTGLPLYINYDRLGYRVLPNVQLANDPNFAYFKDDLRITNAANKYLWLWDDDDTLSVFNKTGISMNSANISGKKILTVGDSITKRGYYQNFIKDASGAVFVGTQTSYYHSIQCEGYSGAPSTAVLGSTGPFWYGGQLDFAQYCSQNNIAPDIVVVQFGLNDTTDPITFVNTIQAFIDSVHDYDPALPVYVLIPFREAYDAWYGSGVIAASRFSTMDLYQCACTDLTDCTLIPAYFVLNDKYDYDTHNVSYGIDNIHVDVIDDGVHPNEDRGFKKLADIIYSYLA